MVIDHLLALMVSISKDNNQFLIAIGVYVDNSLYPIAYAFVDVENIENWSWFLDL